MSSAEVSYLTRQLSYKNEVIAMLELAGNFPPASKAKIKQRASKLTAKLSEPAADGKEFAHPRKADRYTVIAVVNGEGSLGGHRVVIYKSVNRGDVLTRSLIDWHRTMIELR